MATKRPRSRGLNHYYVLVIISSQNKWFLRRLSHVRACHRVGTSRTIYLRGLAICFRGAGICTPHMQIIHILHMQFITAAV